MNKEFTFGGIKSPFDYRDIPLSAILGEVVSLPESYFVDISQLPVWNQRQIPACVGHASAKNKQEDDFIETKQIIPLSPRFIYAVAKATDGNPKGYGTYYRLGVKILQQYGCATESMILNDTSLDIDTYTYNQDLNQIPKAAFDEAKQYAIKSYAQVNLDESSLKQAVMNSKGVLLGVNVDSQWWADVNGNYSMAEKDILPLRPPKQNNGHAVYLYGWEKINGRTAFWIRNSWTSQWGRNGNGYFFYDDYKNYLTEAWSIIDLPNDWINHIKILPPADQFKHYFGQDMKLGDSGDEVKTLQTALKIDGDFPADISETGFYGTITQNSVLKFQRKYKVASLFTLLWLQGKKVGPATRNQLNLLYNK